MNGLANLEGGNIDGDDLWKILGKASDRDGANALLDEHFGALGGWVAAMLVKLGDIKYSFLPADTPDSD